MGDSTLLLGHRISEWCGHAPALEEDIALANTALDLIGQTRMWLAYAGQVEGKGRSEDDLAMLRDAWDFRNLLLVEQPNRDFAQTLARSFLFDRWHLLMLERLTASGDATIAGIAAKAVKEVRYHAERSAELVVGLGDGTEESHARMQAALDRLWPYVAEMFESDATDEALAAAGIAPRPSELRADWDAAVDALLAEATLTRPESQAAQSGGRSGKRHSEHLGHMLTEMQWLQRAYPGATW
ncbi:1,2-phenylacetyl-CoA epoxidase subunit PaaC [Jannaschia ovalis]|uniref:Phenylacetate-CoA oxygenase subunit PaaC n=1 Tax=Jannaschia ovalis TaxID=3038773 RepID=A0ABY8LGB7_9RHOB|nr:1,2-phenylacetyl-CoA epoxidase subunit PaaC [Jannaschia sp. GRR-S6-38]WGH80344.1 phenylacetate-CoA oxygenase subunit PaaC [Jannaschia sp. GRR-S6-38]